MTLFVIENGVADGENDGPAASNSRVGCPVNVTNGNMYLEENDYTLPGIGPAININRTYNSNSQRTGAFGRGWSTAYDESVTALDGNLLRLNRGDGRAFISADQLVRPDLLRRSKETFTDK